MFVRGYEVAYDAPQTPSRMGRVTPLTTPLDGFGVSLWNSFRRNCILACLFSQVLLKS